MAALGALVACALVGAVRCLLPGPRSLTSVLAGLRWSPPEDASAAEVAADGAGMVSSSDLGAVLGGWLRRTAGTAGIDFGTVKADLALIGQPLDAHLGARMLFALGGLLLPGVWVAVVALAGVNAPIPMTLVVSLALAAGGFVLPGIMLRSQAADRRRAFRHAFGSLVIGIHGGAGVESALADAAHLGRGWAFGLIAGTLDATEFNRQSPWEALRELGDELAVPELAELAASISLAGTSGARVGLSVAAKAEAMRGREIAEAEAKAEAASERMAVPTVMMMAGFVMLIGYPALHTVLHGI
jgi:hypothetical protein